MKSTFRICTALFVLINILSLNSCKSRTVSTKSPDFKVIAFYTAKNDAAHISFVHEANKWFSSISSEYNFRYDSTGNWDDMNDSILSEYQVVVFLDTRPDSSYQRAAFRKYMENGGAWMGFHFCAFSLTPSAYNQDWDWYHRDFIGAGQYAGNTWAPTTAVIKVEDTTHPATMNLPEKFTAAPNEWYKWELDLAKNPDIKILASIDPSSFPLGTGPKPHEIWHEGYYPVVWTNIKYRMLYINMGHNIIDYENKTMKELSKTFTVDAQNKLITDGLLWLGKGKK
jgi:uncharacterized protein